MSRYEQEHWDDLSSEAKIQAAGESRWGWVVYRCAYAEKFDARWEEIKRHIIQSLHEKIAKSDAPGIADTMDFVFIEDPALEGASVPQLQRRFQAWVEASDGYKYPENAPTYRGSRYDFFIAVDANAFRNQELMLVRGWTTEEVLDECDADDECETEDWVRLMADSSITTELYEELNNPEFWSTIYSSPEAGCAFI